VGFVVQQDVTMHDGNASCVEGVERLGLQMRRAREYADLRYRQTSVQQGVEDKRIERGQRRAARCEAMQPCGSLALHGVGGRTVQFVPLCLDVPDTACTVNHGQLRCGPPGNGAQERGQLRQLRVAQAAAHVLVGDRSTTKLDNQCARPRR
jgi:hypothetical protein